MSKYTTEVRFICETAAGLTESAGYNQTDSILEDAAPVVFDFDFPIWDESYRLVLEKKILRHYYTREICAETVGLWKLWLFDKLNLIMPYYNELYETTVLEFNPLYNVDYGTTHSGSSSGTGKELSSNSESVQNTEESRRDLQSAKNGSSYGDRDFSEDNLTTKNGSANNQMDSVKSDTDVQSTVDWNMYSDTPQGGLANIETNGDQYLTNITKNTHDNRANSNSGVHNTEKNNTNENGSAHVESSDKRNSLYTENGADREDKNSTTSRVIAGNRVSDNVVSNTNEYIERVAGKIGGATYSSMINEFRTTLINIDEMIIEELKDLFFNLW